MLFSHQSCPILCQPMDCSTSGFPAHYLGFAQVQIHGISMPSNHLILCCPLLLLLSVFPSIRVFSIESAVCIRWPSIGASALALSFQWLFRVLLPLCSSVGKESTCNVGDSGSIPASGEGTGYPLQYSWAYFVAQLVKNPPAMWETWVWSLDWEDPLGKGKATHSSILAWRIPWTVWGHKESDMTKWIDIDFLQLTYSQINYLLVNSVWGSAFQVNAKLCRTMIITNLLKVGASKNTLGWKYFKTNNALWSPSIFWTMGKTLNNFRFG